MVSLTQVCTTGKSRKKDKCLNGNRNRQVFEALCKRKPREKTDQCFFWNSKTLCTGGTPEAVEKTKVI